MISGKKKINWCIAVVSWCDFIFYPSDEFSGLLSVSSYSLSMYEREKQLTGQKEY